MLRFEWEHSIVRKLSLYASELPNCDFIDYWYNLFLWEDKPGLDEPHSHQIAAFWIHIWKDKFEETYTPIAGEHWSEVERAWFAMYMQYLVYNFQTESKAIAEHLGKSGFSWAMQSFSKSHTMGSYAFTLQIADEFGLPPGTEKIYKVAMC